MPRRPILSFNGLATPDSEQQLKHIFIQVPAAESSFFLLLSVFAFFYLCSDNGSKRGGVVDHCLVVPYIACAQYSHVCRESESLCHASIKERILLGEKDPGSTLERARIGVMSI